MSTYETLIFHAQYQKKLTAGKCLRANTPKFEVPEKTPKLKCSDIVQSNVKE